MSEQMDYHIRVRNTSTSNEFTEIIGVSRNIWFEYLQVLTEDLEGVGELNRLNFTDALTH